MRDNMYEITYLHFRISKKAFFFYFYTNKNNVFIYIFTYNDCKIF